MKILFIVPNSTYALRNVLNVTGPPLGIGYLASYVRSENSFKPYILDALTLNFRVKDVLKEVEKINPDVVGLSINFTPSIYDGYELAEAIKEFNPGTTVVAGGLHVTFTPTETLNSSKAIDVVVRGEGEETLLELLKKLKQNEPLNSVEGISYRDGNQVKNNPNRPLIKNLDTLPFPAYDLMPMEKYRMGKTRFSTIITSRGCPFKCIFCSSSRLYGSTWRVRSPENVVKELEMLNREYKINEVEFIDDNFTLNPKRAIKIAELIKEKALSISWSCSSRVDTIVRFPEILKKIKEAGCHTIYVGVESGVQRILNIANKGTTVKQIEKAFKFIREAGLKVVGSFMIGFPTERVEDVKKTINFAKKLRPDIAQFSIVTPYPGTPLFDKVRAEKKILTLDWRKYDVLNPVIKLDEITPEALTNLLKQAYISFYGRFSFLVEQIKNKNFFLLKKGIGAFFQYLRNKILKKNMLF